MKYLLLTIFGTFLAVNIAAGQNKDKVIRLSEPVETGENYEVFGSDFPADVNAKTLNKIIDNSKKFDGKQVTTEGKVKKVCQKKGCFFFLSDGNSEVRVTFKDYSFFIPTNSAGKQIKLKGTFKMKKLSEKKAKHYARDAGEDADKIKGPQVEYRLIASSVKIISGKSR